MPAVVPFYSIDEDAKPSDQRFYHNNTECPIAIDLPPAQRIVGTNGYNQCPTCRKLIELNPPKSVI